MKRRKFIALLASAPLLKFAPKLDALPGPPQGHRFDRIIADDVIAEGTLTIATIREMKRQLEGCPQWPRDGEGKFFFCPGVYQRAELG
jgi:hypothetical protein